MNISPYVLTWTTPKNNIVIIENDDDVTISVISGKTCVFRENLPEDHAAVKEAKDQLTAWAEDLRRSLGASSFYSIQHPEYAPTLVYYPAANPLAPGQVGSSLSISALFRNAMNRLTISSGETSAEIKATK